MAGSSIGLFADQDPARGRRQLKTRGDIDRVTHEHWLPSLARADRPKECIATVDPHPELETAEVLRESSGSALHLQTGTYSALRVVVMSYRRAENRHELIPDNPGDKSAQSMDDVT